MLHILELLHGSMAPTGAFKSQDVTGRQSNHRCAVARFRQCIRHCTALYWDHSALITWLSSSNTGMSSNGPTTHPWDFNSAASYFSCVGKGSCSGLVTGAFGAPHFELLNHVLKEPDFLPQHGPPGRPLTSNLRPLTDNRL